jgi:PAS domain S-box-containing protein
MLKEKSAFYKVCFDSMQMGILVWDKEHKIVLSNNPVAEILGYGNDELIDLDITTLFTGSDIFLDFIENPHKKKFKSTLDLTGINKNGEKIPLELFLGKIDYEDEPYFKALITDITLRKEQETKINYLNLQLEEELKLRNDELERVIEQLKISLSKEKELNHLKTKFIALASHEFKTPLSAILSSTELIVKYADMDSIDKRNEHVTKVKSMIHHLNGILDNLLTLENTESGNIKTYFDYFKFEDLINNIFRNTNPLLKKEQTIKFENYCKEKIYHDQHIIKIILTNLLYNAIKYSKDKGHITVEFKCNSENIFFSVEDNGIGIPKDEQNLIFNRFFRAKNASYYPGTGVGLNIVKGYVNSLNGNISFESIENKGTIFRIQLPKVITYE